LARTGRFLTIDAIALHAGASGLAAGAETGTLLGGVEVLLIAGVNDRDEDAANLRTLTRRRPFKLNIIPYNPGATRVKIAMAGADGQVALTRPSPEQVERFVGRLVPAVPAVTVRWSQGVDVGGGCGQLRGMHRESTGA